MTGTTQTVLFAPVVNNPEPFHPVDISYQSAGVYKNRDNPVGKISNQPTNKPANNNPVVVSIEETNGQFQTENQEADIFKDAHPYVYDHTDEDNEEGITAVHFNERTPITPDDSQEFYQRQLDNLIIRRNQAKLNGDLALVEKINFDLTDFKSTLNPNKPNQEPVYTNYMKYITEGGNELYENNQQSFTSFHEVDDASFEYFDQKNVLLGLEFQKKQAELSGNLELVKNYETQIGDRLFDLDLDDEEMAYLYFNWKDIKTQVGDVESVVKIENPSASKVVDNNNSNKIWDLLEEGKSKKEILDQFGEDQTEQVEYLYTQSTTISKYADACYEAQLNGHDSTIIHKSQKMRDLERKMRLSKDPAVKAVYSQIQEIQQQSKEEYDRQVVYKEIYKDTWDSLINDRPYGSTTDSEITTPEEHEIYLIAHQVFEASTDLTEMYWDFFSGQTTLEEINRYLEHKQSTLPQAYKLLESSLQGIQEHVQVEWTKRIATNAANEDSTWDKIRKGFNFIPLGALANSLFDVSTHKVGWKGFLLELGDTVGEGVHLKGAASKAISAYQNSASVKNGDIPIGGLLAAGFSVAGTLEWNAGGEAVDTFFEKTGVNDAIKEVADDLEAHGKHKLANAFRYSMDLVTNPLQLTMTIGYYAFIDVFDQKAVKSGESDGFTRFLNDMGFEKYEDTANRDVNVGDNVNSLITVFMMEGLKSKSKNPAISKEVFTRDVKAACCVLRAACCVLRAACCVLLHKHTVCVFVLINGHTNTHTRRCSARVLRVRVLHSHPPPASGGSDCMWCHEAGTSPSKSGLAGATRWAAMDCMPQGAVRAAHPAAGDALRDCAVAFDDKVMAIRYNKTKTSSSASKAAASQPPFAN
jgi:hypothetical protein